MAENIRVSIFGNDRRRDCQTYTIDYFLDLMEQLRESDTTGNMKWAISDNIAKALSSNPNLNVAHLERILSFAHEHTRQDTLKTILKRRDREKFIDRVFSVIESSEDNFTVYLLGTAILFDAGLEGHHARAMKALTGLRDRRGYNVQLKEFLIGPCLPYQFFIQGMLNHVTSVEEAEKWLGEYDRLEELFLLREDQVSGDCIKDPVKREEHRKRVRERERENMYRSVAGNRNLPLDYLKRFFDYADTIQDETSRLYFLGLLISNPGITSEECQRLFETKKRQLKNKNLINSLLGSVAANPRHFSMYFDYIIKYFKLKPTDPRYRLLWVLINNPGLDRQRLDSLLDAVTGIEYSIDTKDLRQLLGMRGWSLVLLLNGPDLEETHHEKIRREVMKFLEMINSEAFYGKYKNVGRRCVSVDYLNESHLLFILPKVRLNEDLVNYLFDYVDMKDNGGLLISGLLPNPSLTREWYDRAVDILEKQYAGREERYLISQRSTFCAEKVYELWPASQYVR